MRLKKVSSLKTGPRPETAPIKGMPINLETIPSKIIGFIVTACIKSGLFLWIKK